MLLALLLKLVKIAFPAKDLKYLIKAAQTYNDDVTSCSESSCSSSFGGTVLANIELYILSKSCDLQMIAT